MSVPKDIKDESILDLINGIGVLLTEMDGVPRDPIVIERVYTDHLCSMCGRKVAVPAADRSAPGEVRWVCHQCAAWDRPESKPDTGWGFKG